MDKEKRDRIYRKMNLEIIGNEIKREQPRIIIKEKRKKDDKRYNLLTSLIIRELENRTLEFNDENINLVLDLALSLRHFLVFANDDRISIINAVKRKYNGLNKKQNNNGEQNGQAKDRE